MALSNWDLSSTALKSKPPQLGQVLLPSTGGAATFSSSALCFSTMAEGLTVDATGSGEGAGVGVVGAAVAGLPLACKTLSSFWLISSSLLNTFCSNSDKSDSPQIIKMFYLLLIK